MTPWRLACAAAIFFAAVGRPDPVRAQEAELAPYFGYRFGGDFFEIAAQHPVDADGGPAVGFVLNVFLQWSEVLLGLIMLPGGDTRTAMTAIASFSTQFRVGGPLTAAAAIIVALIHVGVAAKP